MSRTIKIMPEYDCYSIWVSENDEAYENISPDSLNISNELKKRIDNWEEKYELTLNSENPSDSGFKNAVLEKEFEKEGVLIWTILSEELSNDLILFHSIVNNKLYFKEDYPN